MNSMGDTRGGLNLDLELIAQRILKLAEISTLDHLEALARSQAEGLVGLFETAGGTTEFSPEFGSGW